MKNMIHTLLIVFTILLATGIIGLVIIYVAEKKPQKTPQEIPRLGLQEDIRELQNKVNILMNEFMVEDYFYDKDYAPDTNKYTRKDDAVEFKKISYYCLINCAKTYYTTKANYKQFKTQIDKWAKEIE